MSWIQSIKMPDRIEGAWPRQYHFLFSYCLANLSKYPYKLNEVCMDSDSYFVLKNIKITSSHQVLEYFVQNLGYKGSYFNCFNDCIFVCEQGVMYAKVEPYLSKGGEPKLYIGSLIWASSKFENEKIKKIIRDEREEVDEFRPRSFPEKNVYTFVLDSAGELILESLGAINYPFKNVNYTNLVCEKYKFIMEELNSKSPIGRIVIFQGEPGTGKTWLLRNIISEIKDHICVILKPSFIPKLSEPSTLSTLLNVKGTELPLLFLVEDADELLAKRTGTNMESVSSLLNLGDGIIGSLLDIRIILTSNTIVSEFDEAILRPGRLLDIINIGLLSPDEANKCYNVLREDKNLKPTNDKKYYNNTSLAQIYQDVLRELRMNT